MPEPAQERTKQPAEKKNLSPAEKLVLSKGERDLVAKIVSDNWLTLMQEQGKIYEAKKDDTSPLAKIANIFGGSKVWVTLSSGDVTGGSRQLFQLHIYSGSEEVGLVTSEKYFKDDPKGGLPVPREPKTRLETAAMLAAEFRILDLLGSIRERDTTYFEQRNRGTLPHETAEALKKQLRLPPNALQDVPFEFSDNNVKLALKGPRGQLLGTIKYHQPSGKTELTLTESYEQLIKRATHPPRAHKK